MRSWGTGAIALVVGMLVGYFAGRGSALPRPRGGVGGEIARRTAHGPALSASARKLRPGQVSTTDGSSTITLGEIATVPFQELYGVLSTLPKEKLEDLAAQLQRLPDTVQTRDKISAFYKAWAHFDAISALQTASKLSTIEEKNTAARAVLESADNAVAGSLARQISEWSADAIPVGQKNLLLGLATTKWAQTNPVEAAKFLDSLNVNDMNFMGALHQIGMSWGALDPAAAMAWAQAHSGQSIFAGSAMNGALQGWWQKDHAGAENFVLSHLTSLADRQMVSTLAANMWTADPERAVAFVNRIPDLEARTQADSILAMQMGMNDPQAASNWAANLPNDVRSSVLRSAVSHWAATNLTGPAGWINTLSGSPRDEAIDAYSSFVARSDPGAAAAWASSISDQQTRTRTLDRVAATWMANDPSGASAWIQGSSLADNEKRRLLALKPGG